MSNLLKYTMLDRNLELASRWDQFIAILMSQLSCRQSQRYSIQFGVPTGKTKSSRSKVYSRSTLARINEQQPAALYQQLFYKLLKYYEHSKVAHKFPLRIPCIPWMPVILTCRFPYVNGPKFMTQKPA